MTLYYILAPEAAEVIHQAVLIIRNGLTIRDIMEKIDVYPTLSEMVKLCAQSFYKDVKKLSCCAEWDLKIYLIISRFQVIL